MKGICETYAECRLHHMLLMASVFSVGAAPLVPDQHGEGQEDEEYPEYGEDHDQGIVQEVACFLDSFHEGFVLGRN